MTRPSSRSWCRITLRKKHAAEADKARRDAAKEQKIAAQARRIAIQRLTEFKRDYPDASKLDQVLYQLAFEHEQAGNADAARKAYLELIQKAPKSDYVPNAYLAFGELFFQEAQGDPAKWELAIQAYREVVRYPAPANKVHGYARYKLGYVFWNRGEHVEAMSELKKVVELADKYPTLPNAKGLAGAARRDLVPLYAASGAPEQAFRFFAQVSGDKSGETSRTIALMGELGVAYLDTGRYREALVLVPGPARTRSRRAQLRLPVAHRRSDGRPALGGQGRDPARARAATRGAQRVRGAKTTPRRRSLRAATAPRSS